MSAASWSSCPGSLRERGVAIGPTPSHGTGQTAGLFPPEDTYELEENSACTLERMEKLNGGRCHGHCLRTALAGHCLLESVTLKKSGRGFPDHTPCVPTPLSPFRITHVSHDLPRALQAQKGMASVTAEWTVPDVKGPCAVGCFRSSESGNRPLLDLGFFR